ncbi:P pilus assembly protein, chaperone PapD [Oceanithermus sp.]
MKTLCAIVFAAAFPALVLAQTGVGVSPPRVVLEAQPGETVQGVVVVDHPGSDAPMQVDVSLSDVIVQPNGEPAYLDPGSVPQSAALWISVAPPSFTLAPKETREIRYSVHIPPGCASGTHWAVIFFDSGPVQKSQTKGVGVKMRVRVGHVVYVNVGRITQKGAIRGVRYQPPTSRNPPEIRVRFRNTGNGLMRLNGYVELRDAAGETVGRAVISNAASLPGYEYEISGQLEQAPASGEYLALIMLDYGGDEALIGEGKVRVP